MKLFAQFHNRLRRYNTKEKWSFINSIRIATSHCTTIPFKIIIRSTEILFYIILLLLNKYNTTYSKRDTRYKMQSAKRLNTYY